MLNLVASIVASFLELAVTRSRHWRMRDGKEVNEAAWQYLDTGRALSNEGNTAQKTADRLTSLRELRSVTERCHPTRMPQARHQGKAVEPIDRFLADGLRQGRTIQRDDEFKKYWWICVIIEYVVYRIFLSHSETQPETISVQCFESRLAYCGCTKHARLSPGLVAGIFEALQWKQIPIVSGEGSGNDSEWDEVLSPDLQAKLPVVKCVRDPVGIRATVEATLRRFDATGSTGGLQRYHYSLHNLIGVMQYHVIFV